VNVQEQADLLRGFDSLPDSARVRAPVVQALYGGISPATLWRKAKAGDAIPAPEKTVGGTTWGVGALRAALNRNSDSAKSA
jgi:hypothetical protein